jgi:predicted HTH domain antitoxin
MTAFTSEHPLPAFVSDEEARLMLAVKLFETGRLSLGQAAEMCGYSKQGFIDVLGHQGIPVVQYPASELAVETAW